MTSTSASDPDRERTALIPSIEWALFGCEDGGLLHDESILPVGELRRLLREVWARGSATPAAEAPPTVYRSVIRKRLEKTRHRYWMKGGEVNIRELVDQAFGAVAECGIRVADDDFQQPFPTTAPTVEALDTARCGAGIPIGPLVRGMWVCVLDRGHEGPHRHGREDAYAASPVVGDRPSPADRAVIDAAEALTDHAPLLIMSVRNAEMRDLITTLAAAVRARGAGPDTTTEKD